MAKLIKIGITMRLESRTGRFYLGRDYSEALAGLGAVPVHISLIPTQDYIEGILDDLDGILLPGSDTDVDPHRYGTEPGPFLKTVIPEKDETDLLVLGEAEKRGLPLLAICFGMQILNVSRGGSLVQDIYTEVANPLKHEQGEPLGRASHGISIEENSILSRLITTEEVRVNSHHHQSIGDIGENLRATAFAKDGVIECIEDTRPDRFVFGAQWHPELSWSTDPLSKNIFSKLIENAGKFSIDRRSI